MWATAALAALCALSGSLALPPAPSSAPTPSSTHAPSSSSSPAPPPSSTTTSTGPPEDSMAAETSVHRAPWQQTVADPSGKGAASGDVEIVRSIELDLVFDDDRNATDSNSSSRVPTLNEHLNEYSGGRGDTSRFKPSPAIPFRPEDVLLAATSSESHHVPCKEIRTRSISEDDEPDLNDFDLQSRLLLGKVLLRGRAAAAVAAGDSSESASARQARVLDFEPIHTSKNDYPVESVPRRTTTTTTKSTTKSSTAAAARRLAARSRARNLANHTQAATVSSTKAPATTPIRGEATSTTAAPTASPLTRAAAASTEAPPPPPGGGEGVRQRGEGEGEGVAAAASSLEFGAKTAHAGERGATRYRAAASSSTPRPGPPGPPVPVPPPVFVPASGPAPAPADASVAPGAEAQAEAEAETGAETARDESGGPYSTVSIHRGNVDPIPYAPPRDVHLVPVRVHKQQPPTQVIFIQPYAPSDLKQQPAPPADVTGPGPGGHTHAHAHAGAPHSPFDAHQWVPVYVQEAYVPLLVEPRRQPHVHHLDTYHQHHHHHHPLPFAFADTRHALADFSSVALQYPSEAWSWTSHQHSTPSSFSGESSIADKNYIR